MIEHGIMSQSEFATDSHQNDLKIEFRLSECDNFALIIVYLPLPNVTAKHI